MPLAGPAPPFSQSLSPEAFVTMLPLIFYAMDKAGGYGPLTSAVFFSTLPPPLQGAYPAFKVQGDGL